MNKRWLYDEEVYPNLFLLTAKNTITKEIRRFQVSPLGDDRNALALWLRDEVDEMVGFNNLFYDYPVLHHALSVAWNLRGRDFCSSVFKFSDALIKGKRNYLKESSFVRKQIDLFKINHYDNKAKMTSLKLLQFNLRLKNIRELPYAPGTILTNEQIQIVIDYCDNDVDATELVYVETLAEIELREKMSPIYGIDFTNFNSTKMGEYILISKIIQSLGENVVYDKYETDTGIKRKIRNTKRDFIDLNDVIFPYVRFTTEPFQKMLTWFKGRTITETKGVFSEIPFDELTILEPHYAVEKKNGKQQTLNVIYKGFQYDFGVGGIHGSVDPGIYQADDNYEIWDWDVASYYPNLAIKNRFYPEHFGEVFCDIYEGIYIERQGYPKKTHPAENIALKLALNGSYGKSNSEYSALYDPAYTMKTTVNGQLLLCMLSERLMEEIPDCTMLQINTDGMTIRVHKKYIEQMKTICARWEKLTMLELESVTYSKMIIANVNNYIAVKETGGDPKRKGAAFIYKVAPGELELHKNFSMLIVPKALEAYFVYGKPVEEFIRNHDDVYDFFKRTKVNRTDKLYLRTCGEKAETLFQEEVQRIVRYYISGSQHYHKETKSWSYNGTGGILIKEMPPLAQKETKKLLTDFAKIQKDGYPGTLEDFKKSLIKPRESNIEAGYLCSIANDMDLISVEQIKSTINYQYYIDEVYKVIDSIENNK